MLTDRSALIARATRLAAFTVAWNVAEGGVAIAAASAAGSRALLGFGIDSFVESVCGWVVLWRLGVERRGPRRAEEVERRALKLIGVAFFALAAVVAVESIRTLIYANEPEATRVGIALTALSLLVMPVLARRKRQVGRAMGSRLVERTAARRRPASTCRWSCWWGSR